VALSDEERAERAARCKNCKEPATKLVTIHNPQSGAHTHRLCEACLVAAMDNVRSANAYSAKWATVDVHLTAEISELPVPV